MNFSQLLPATALAAAALSPVSASAASITDPNLSEWYQNFQGTSGNVKADTNGDAGWHFNGTGGYAYDFGNLRPNGTGADGTSAAWSGFQGNTYEFVINIAAANGATQCFASALGWDAAETGAYGLWNYSSGYFGDMKNGNWSDIAARNGRYEYGETALLTFVMRPPTADEIAANIKPNVVDFYLNGVFAGTGWAGDRWNQGGQGYLGSLNNGTSNPLSDGSVIYGIATYDRALTASEIAANYAAVTTIPEPSTYAFAGIAGLTLAGAALYRRRRA